VGGVQKRQQKKKKGIFERHMGVMYVISSCGNIKTGAKRGREY
jgi:hypothetical protein